MIRQELCKNCGPLDFIDKEGCEIVVGELSMAYLSTIEEITMLCASFVIAKLILTYTILTNAYGTMAAGILM